MQLHKRYKHIWFVFLMIFFIGGSSVAVAAVQTIQSDHISTAILHRMPCHKQHVVETYHTAHTDKQAVAKCHEQQMPHNQHCQDCYGAVHCQILNLALDQQLPALFSVPFVESSPQLHSDYQARHLAGYWQEILRPPKA